MAYRADIDGLRAIAVGLVVIFHAKLNIFSGGYIGVDVFFVISGYLIASIIAEDIANNCFSIAQFYARRARRILPALFVVLAASSAAAFYLLTLPQDLEVFAKSVRAALLFISNFYFAQTTGYFRPAQETQALLHTWSLGVEEQFYLVAPLLLLVLLRFSPRRQKLIFGGVFLFFLVLSQHYAMQGNSTAFFGPQTRIFELMIGVALALGYGSLRLSEVGRNWIAGAGLAMILFAALAFTPRTPFPGLAALFPCLGAALLIRAGEGGTNLMARLLSTRQIVFIGKISYPLYLWHWPIFVFAAALPTPLTSPAERIALIALAFALSIVTYYFIERPIRRIAVEGPLQRRGALIAAAVGISIFLIPAQGIIATKGWANRFGPVVAAYIRENPTTNPKSGLCESGPSGFSLPNSDCIIGAADAAMASFIVWGDSHATTLAPAISALAKARGLKGYLVARGGCPPLVVTADNWKGEAKCVDAAKRALRLLSDHAIKRVIMAARWSLYAEGPLRHEQEMESDPASAGLNDRHTFASLLLRTVESAASEKRHVTLIGPTPEPAVNVPRTLTRALIGGHTIDISIPRSEFQKRNAVVFAALEAVNQPERIHVIYPHGLLCDEIECAASEKGKALYIDDNHLNSRGVAKLSGLIRSLFDDAAPNRDPVARIATAPR